MSDDHSEQSGASLDNFKETVNHYMESHAKAAQKYEAHIDEILSKYQTEGAQGKTIGDLLKDGGELDKSLQKAFDKHLEDLGFKADKYGKEVLLRDLGVSIEDLREDYKGRLNEKYSSRMISDIMDRAEGILTRKLGNAVLAELQRLEGTDQYKGGVQHIVELSDLEQRLPTLQDDALSHADVAQKLSQYQFQRNISGKAKAYLDQGKYDSGGGEHH